METQMRQLSPADYPEGLREIPEIPSSLYIRGSLPPEGTVYLTVVGSRDLSSYGREAGERLITGLAGHPICIVSGLALGADACAHRAALAAGLHTIAFPGSGIGDRTIAPRTNAGLAAEILESGGALMSEYSPDTVAAPWMFPARNRLMVGIARAVLVLEAGERSGTLITARLSGEYNRDLLCVPYRIGDRGGYAANLFIRLGAALVAEPSHILEALGIRQERTVSDTTTLDLTPTEQILFELLSQPRSRDEIIRDSGLPAHEVLTALVMLELRGVLKEEFGAWRRA
ncbi:MAG: DNA-processing protein DprA [Patescibacteria group bacterium]